MDYLEIINTILSGLVALCVILQAVSLSYERRRRLGSREVQAFTASEEECGDGTVDLVFLVKGDVVTWLRPWASQEGGLQKLRIESLGPNLMRVDFRTRRTLADGFRIQR